MAISKTQPIRPALIDAVDALNEGTSGSGTIAATHPIEISSDGSIGLLYDTDSFSVNTSGKLELLSTLRSIITSMPTLQFGTSNSVTVPANSQVSVDVDFTATTTEEPLVFVSLQHSQNYTNLSVAVSNVTNQQASIVVVNNGSTEVDNLTIDWLAVSGR